MWYQFLIWNDTTTKFVIINGVIYIRCEGNLYSRQSIKLSCGCTEIEENASSALLMISYFVYYSSCVVWLSAWLRKLVLIGKSMIVGVAVALTILLKYVYTYNVVKV